MASNIARDSGRDSDSGAAKVQVFRREIFHGLSFIGARIQVGRILIGNLVEYGAVSSSKYFALRLSDGAHCTIGTVDSLLVGGSMAVSEP